MEKKDRGFKIVAIVALLVATLGLTIAYAGFTAILDISGSTTATVSSKFSVIWTDITTGENIGKTGYAVPGSLTISNANKTVSGNIGTLKAPGDSITYSWYAKNDGDIDAVLTNVSPVGALTCAPAATNGSTGEEATAVCSKLVLTLKYNDTAVASATNVDLLKGTSKKVELTLSYPAGDPVQVSGDVAVTLGQTKFNYAQK